MTLDLPDPRAALILKAFAYRGRFSDRDAVDIWRLLVVANRAGMDVSDWPSSKAGEEAAHHLHRFFGTPASLGAKKASANPRDQAMVRLLVRQVVRLPTV